MASEKDERLSTEVALLESMYPDQIVYIEKARELSYTADSHNANVQLRLPDGYLSTSLPEVLSANAGKRDLRDTVKHIIANQEPGVESLDSIIDSFNAEAEKTINQQQDVIDGNSSQQQASASSNTTIIIFLHHLLNTNKRKLCLSPSHSEISGVTKPGYPGVLIYSGPSQAVHEHVNELKAQNWQAFQIRSELEGEQWDFKHGRGVVEVEGMSDIVAEVDVENGRKDVFMEAMRMK